MKIFAKGIVADRITLKASGTDVLKVSYRFNSDVHWAEIMKLRLDISRLLEKHTPDYEKVGEYVASMFEIVFGHDCVQQMLEFFDGSFNSLIENLLPVFQYKIYPACELSRKRVIKARKKAK